MALEYWENILVELLRDESDTLTAWEVEFIESVEQQRHRDGRHNWCPSPKQQDVLLKIWNKVFS